MTHPGSGSAVLADWVHALQFDDLMERATNRLVDSIIDGIGCALHGATMPWAVAARQSVAHPQEAGPGSAWGTTERLPVQAATFTNGVAIHAFELDDFNDLAAGVHGTSAILPSVFGAAELGYRIDGSALLTAAAAGWEVAVRVARCLGPDFPQRGWHASAIFATIGGAAATGKAIGLSRDQLEHCISLAVLSASGLLVARTGGMGKRIYAGHAAANAMLAARLAAAGVTGPEAVFEHPNGGFCTTFMPDGGYDLGLLEAEDRPSAAEGIVLKLHASCGSTHPLVDALLDLQRDHPELRAERVETIDIGMGHANVRFLGQPYRPVDATTAQFSVPYCVAAVLIEGEVTAHQFRDELIDAPHLMRLAERINVRRDAEIDAGGVEQRNAARVDITLVDGSKLSARRQSARGSSRDPLETNQVDDKFVSMAAHSLPAEQGGQLLRQLRSLPSVDELGGLLKLMRPPAVQT